jgi:selenocysteine-specific elongation factor
MKGERALPGEEQLVQVRTERPLVAGPADRFIIRGLSPVTTVGGGMIIEPLAYRLRRTHPGAAEDLAERAAAVAEPDSFAAYCLAVTGDGGIAAEALARRIKATPREAGAILVSLDSEGKAVALGGLYLDGAACARAGEAVIAAVQKYHEAAPESTGIELEVLREVTGLEEAVFEGLVGKLERDGRLKRAGGRIALAGYEAVVPDADKAVFSAVEAAFKDRPFAPPDVDDVIAKSGFEAARVKKAVGVFLERGVLVRVAEGLFFHAVAVEEARRRLEEYIRREGKLESVKFKYLLDTTRKYAIPLLDYFDSVGVTVRAGNTRYLKET